MQTGLYAIEGLSTALAGQNRVAGGLTPGSESSAGAQPFGDLLAGAVSQVNALENQARAAVDGLIAGSGVDVHQAMIATQKSEMAFELALAVRNKAVQAYQQVMGMQF